MEKGDGKMTASELIQALLIEAGQNKLAKQVKARLENNEVGQKPINVNITYNEPCRYVTNINHHTGFIMLELED